MARRRDGLDPTVRLLPRGRRGRSHNACRKRGRIQTAFALRSLVYVPCLALALALAMCFFDSRRWFLAVFALTERPLSLPTDT